MNAFLLDVKDQGLDFDINGIKNGMMIQKRKIDPATGEKAGTHAWHPDYNTKIENCLKGIMSGYDATKTGATLNKLNAFINKTKQHLMDEVIDKATTTVNDLDLKC